MRAVGLGGRASEGLKVKQKRVYRLTLTEIPRADSKPDTNSG
jgi:hypothetical protein